MDLHTEHFTKGLIIAGVGLVVGLVTTFTGMTIANSNRVATLEANLLWIRASLERIEQRQHKQ